MEIQGNIIAVLDKRSGVSKSTGKEWSSQEYVIETHEQYPKKCCFNVFGEDKINTFAIKAGEELKVSFDIDAHEYQGRYFNNINAWKVERTADKATAPTDKAASPTGTAEAAPQAAEAAPQPAAPPAEDADDLPF